jgi:type IV pilus assembly protein PilC
MSEFNEKYKLKNLDDKTFDCHVRLRDEPGKSQKLIVEAASREAVTQKLLAQGYMVVDVRERGHGGGLQSLLSLFFQASGNNTGGPFSSLLEHVTTRELIFFAVQLSTLLKAGIPLLRALEIIDKGISKPYFKKVILDLRRRVSEGGTFSVALRHYHKVFPWIWGNLVEVGETTGKLPECLEEIAQYQESAARIKQKVVTAFFYPGILSVAVTGALVFLLIFIVPKFSAIFLAQKMELPALTQIVLAMSEVLRKHFLWVVGIVAAAAIAFNYTKKVPAIKMEYDRMALEAPLFGPILMQVAVVRFTRSLGTLLRSGVQILQALEIGGRLMENQYIEAGITEVTKQVRSGQGLGIQLENRKIFPVFVSQLITVGEESGQLELFLDLLAKYYEEQVDTFLARLTTLLEPFLLVFMGGVIGTIVISMFLPIIELSTRGGGG